MGNRAFPDRQILLRADGRVRLVPLPTWLQATIVVACIAAFGGMSCFGFGYFALHRRLSRVIATSRSAPIASSARHHDAAKVAALDQQLARAQQRYATLKQRYAAAALSPASTATDQTQPHLQRKLANTEQQLSVDKDAVTHLKDDITALRAELQKAAQAQVSAAASAHRVQAALREMTARANRLKVMAEAKDAQVAMLRQEIAPATGTAASSELSGANGKVTKRVVNRFERMLASTGVHLRKLLHDISSSPAEGGPFVALGSIRSTALEQRRLDALLKVAKLLPLRSPLAVRYVLGSPFGARLDPFNHRPEFHTGVDLDAPYESPVYSTAPGVVVFTGWDGGYGKLVKIYHGHGIETYYAHLHRILVAKGERVAAHVEIGVLGSTGRSTGPHLHYEIRLDGHPVDPERFLEAGGHLVQASALAH
jgi:murein DD-endopeptidase MepM/ murein hydrolase activator NlpD